MREYHRLDFANSVFEDFLKNFYHLAANLAALGIIVIALSVPYAEKDQAKALGAKWDADRKTWYVPEGVMATQFEKWLSSSSLADALLASARKVAGKGAQKPSGKRAKARRPRVDERVSKVIVGKDYVPSEGAVEPPWDL